jgi:phosphoribosylglycinamide formyltransferase 1
VTATTPYVRIAALIPGGGSNLQAILDAIEAGSIHGRIVLVISDIPNAYGLERARAAGIPTVVMRPREYLSRAEYSSALASRLHEAQADLVIMAGFMRVLTKELTEPFAGRIMNIHPALVPSFCGPGFFGHHVHEAVLRAGVKVSGCTVHFVEEEVDAGPIILQRVVPVLDDDSEDTLAARVLVEEHLAYPEAVRLYCEGRLRIEGRRVRILPHPSPA